jgi:hypothetical protein
MKVFLMFLSFLAIVPTYALAQDEIALFNGHGRASAYIAVDDELTIYLWSGKPVAYLSSSENGGYDVYGFNGVHLGWFLKGVIRNHDGDAVCATKERMATTESEPFKGFKEFKPFKAFKEFAPFIPSFSSVWADEPCSLALAAGSV